MELNLKLLEEEILTHHWKTGRQIRDELIEYRLRNKSFWTPKLIVHISVRGGIYVFLNTLVEKGVAEIRELPSARDTIKRFEWRLKARVKRTRSTIPLGTLKTA